MDDDLRTQATEFIEKNFPEILETREFYSLPTIKLELIGEKRKLIGDLVINWIVEQLRKDNSNLQELCEYVRRLVRMNICSLREMIRFRCIYSISMEKNCKIVLIWRKKILNSVM